MSKSLNRFDRSVVLHALTPDRVHPCRMTINRLCEDRQWDDAHVVQLAFHFLEGEGLLHEFLNYLDEVAMDERDAEFEGWRCPDCNAPLDPQGHCTECHEP